MWQEMAGFLLTLQNSCDYICTLGLKTKMPSEDAANTPVHGAALTQNPKMGQGHTGLGKVDRWCLCQGCPETCASPTHSHSGISAIDSSGSDFPEEVWAPAAGASSDLGLTDGVCG